MLMQKYNPKFTIEGENKKFLPSVIIISINFNVIILGG